jgi:hypothetical protein
LPPKMPIAFIRRCFASVARALLSHGLVVGKRPQNTLVRFLVHPFGPDRHSAAFSPFKSRA